MAPQDRKQKGKILVIDDEPVNRTFLTNILTEQGYAVCPANDGESGLQLAKRTLPDLVLVDISMPGINGYQVCASLKNDPTIRNIPLILIVPTHHPINQPKAMLSGSVDYIASPFDAQEVLWRIETHISLHRLRENLESAIRGRATKQTVTCEELERALRETLALTRITGRKHAEEKLRERESELRQVLDLAPQHIAVLGPDGSRLFANQASLDYYGLTLGSWRSSDPVRFLHPDDLERMESLAQHTELSNASTHHAEVRLLRKDETYRWFLIRRNALLDGRGHLLRWYVAATDIEDRKQAEERLQTENVVLREEIDKASMLEEIVGNSPALQTVLSRVAKVAPTETTVLVTGETGTGKELVARAIHRLSRRSQRAFVSMNCAAVPRDLIASELFGHEKGAFTGATQRRLGRFELAEGGTVFLDEIGELPGETQVALLRVLQEHEFERVGGTQSIRTDVRVIAATNRDLDVAISAGVFRSDLLYRLNVFPIEVPSLEERREDIPILVEYFIDRFARRAGRKITGINKKSLDLLQAYPWPGNIRELQNVIERSLIVSSGDIFSVDESWLSKGLSPRAPRIQAPTPVEPDQPGEREIIESALAETRGRVYGPAGAAAKLGIPRSTLESRIRALKIQKSRFKFG